MFGTTHVLTWADQAWDDVRAGRETAPWRLSIVPPRPQLNRRQARGREKHPRTGLRPACSIANKMPSVIFSLEMGRNEIAMRLLSAEARVALRLKADPDFAGAGGGRTV
jgi:hypothetical protein